MRVLKILLVIASTMLLSSYVQAQTVTFIPHYPETAFITNRLIPVTVNADGDVEIKSVKLSQGSDGCIAFMDRYYKNIFHFYCDGITQAVADVEYTINSGERFVSSTEVINILSEADLTENPAPSSGPGNSNFQKSGVDE